MIAALVRSVFAGLLVAGLVHVVAVLTLPDAAPGDAVERVARTAETGRFTVVPADGSLLGDLDPWFVHAVCPFDLADGPVEVTGRMPADVWSLAVAAGAGTLSGSLDRAAVADDRMDVVLGRPADLERIRLERAESGRLATMMEVEADRGFVLLRAFDGPRADAADIAALLEAVRCEAAD